MCAGVEVAAQLKIASYFNLGTIPVIWRMWLATKGPILTRLGVDATWDNADATHGNLDVYKPRSVRGGHAVALVGYTADRSVHIRRNVKGEKGLG